MLRASLRPLAPVYIQLCDNSRIELHRGMSRLGVGFNIKVELGFSVVEMDVRTFQRLIDDHFKKVSPNYHTCMGSNVYNEHYKRVDTVYAGERYYVGGMMKQGYMKGDPKFNAKRLTGMQGNYKGGLQWNGEKW
jgi:hypothetical protein